MRSPGAAAKSSTVTNRHSLSGVAAAHLEYVHGVETLEALAKKHGLTPEALRKASERGKWTDGRKAFRDKVRAEIAAEALEETIRFARESAEEERKLTRGLRIRLSQAIRDNADPAHYAGLSSAGSALEKFQRVGRLACGLSTENKQVTGANGGPVQTQALPDLTLLTDEELEAFGRLARKTTLA